jgi:hypothetical protein
MVEGVIQQSTKIQKRRHNTCSKTKKMCLQVGALDDV